MGFKLQARPYSPESTPEEITAIKNRISLYRDDIIMYREMPVQSSFHLDLFQERLTELAAKMPSYALLVDLTEAEFPSVQIRMKLRTVLGAQRNLRKIAVFTGRNALINVAAKFVLGDLGTKPFSVHKTKDDALGALTLGLSAWV